MRRVRRLPYAALHTVASFAVPATIRGQGYLLWQLNAPPHYTFGYSVAGAGDVDGDSVPDILVGAPHGPIFAGRVTVFSGATGTRLLVLDGAAPMDRFGSAVAGVGDIDGDGREDFVVGAPRALNDLGQATLYSGANGTILFVVNGASPQAGLGHSVAGAGDLDGDGVPDVLVGAPYANPARLPLPGQWSGQVLALSGASGATLLTLSPPSGAGGGFGRSVAGPGDASGDGVPDILVGGLFSTVPGSSAGQATLFSGSNGTIVYAWSGVANGDEFGKSVAGLGDVDGDGIPDLAVGASMTALAGMVRVFSGGTGGVLYTITGTGSLGASVAGGGDVNGDGTPDLIAGAPSALAYSGEVRVFAGGTGTLLGAFQGQFSEGLGWSVAGIGDVDGDAFADFVAGGPWLLPLGAVAATGEAKALSLVGIPSGSSLFGSGCAGSGGFVPVIRTTGGAPLVGNSSLAILISRAFGGANAVLIAGASSQSWMGFALPLNLGPVGLPACSLLVSADAMLSTTTAGSGPGAGVANVPVPVPTDPQLVGTDAHFQWYVVDPGPGPVPGSMSPGLRVRIL